MKYYNVPIYQGSTTIKKLEPCGNAIVSRDIFGRVFFASDSIPVDVQANVGIFGVYAKRKPSFMNKEGQENALSA